MDGKIAPKGKARRPGMISAILLAAILGLLAVFSAGCPGQPPQRTAQDLAAEDDEPVGPGPTTVGDAETVDVSGPTTTQQAIVAEIPEPPTTTTTLTAEERQMLQMAELLKRGLPPKITKVEVRALKPALTVDIYAPRSTPEAEMSALLQKAWSLLGASRSQNYSIALIESEAALPKGLAQLNYYDATGLLLIQTRQGKRLREVVRTSLQVPKPPAGPSGRRAAGSGLLGPAELARHAKERRQAENLAAFLKAGLPAQVSRVQVTTIRPVMNVNLYVPGSAADSDLEAVLRRAWRLLPDRSTKSVSIAAIENTVPRPRHMPRGLVQLNYYPVTKSLEIQTRTGEVTRESIRFR